MLKILKKWDLPTNKHKVLLIIEMQGLSFYTKKDFKKLYFINDETYELLSPYILLPDSISGSKQSKKTKEQITVELNTVDSINLIKVPGIGGYRAKKY